MLSLYSTQKNIKVPKVDNIAPELYFGDLKFEKKEKFENHTDLSKYDGNISRPGLPAVRHVEREVHNREQLGSGSDGR